LVRETIRFLVEEKKEISIPQYDFKTQTYKGKKKIYPADVIILEGILTLTNAEVYEAADIKIYVDVSDDERLIRRILRDKTERGADVKKTIDM
jgi:uridine kinase